MRTRRARKGFTLAGRMAVALPVIGCLLIVNGRGFAASAGSAVNRARSAAAAKEKSASTTAKDKIPSAVTYRLKSVEKNLQRAEEILNSQSAASNEWRVEASRGEIKKAREAMNEIQTRYGAQAPKDHPEIKATEERIAAVEKKIDNFAAGNAAVKEQAAQTAASAAASSADWIKRLQPFVANNPGVPNYNKDKYFIASATEDQKEMETRLKICAEAQAAFEEYKKASFPSGKSSQLQEIETTLAKALKDFQNSVVETADRRLTKAAKQLDECLEFLAEQEKKKDPKDMPLPVQKDQLRDILKEIEAVSILIKKDDPRLAAMGKKVAEIERRDSAIRKLRVSQTRMIADKFKGKEIEDLRKRANEIVAKKFEGARILRTTIISPDWKEESVIEWTDTTRSALRSRTTRSVTAQVGAKVGNDCNIYTCDLNKDRRADGTFGELNGHIMFTDPILEENVSK